MTTRMQELGHFERETLESEKLREVAIREGMTNTAGLVRAYNAATDPLETRLLRRWLDKYISWFARQNTLAFTPNILESYTQLARVKHRGRWDRELPKQFFFTLVSRLEGSNYAIQNTLAALEHTLNQIDPLVLEYEASDLLRLAQILLAHFDTNGRPDLKINQVHFGLTLFAFHQAIAVFKMVAPEGLPDKFYDGFLDVLRKLEKCDGYYPFIYYVRLVKHSIKNLKDLKTVGPWMKHSRLQFHGLTQSLNVLQRQTAVLQFGLDVNPKQGGHGFGRSLSKRRRDKWTHWLQELLEAAAKSVETGEFEHFRQQLDAAKKAERPWHKEKNSKMLRYCIISQLRMLVMESENPTCGGEAMVELLKYAVQSSSNTWIQDLDIFEAVLDALYAIHLKNGQGAENAANNLRNLTSSRDARLHESVQAWMGRGRTIEDILAQRALAETNERDELFEQMRDMMGSHLRWTDLAFNISELRRNYLSPFFSKVQTIFNEWILKHVKDFKYRIVRYDDAPIRREVVDVRQSNRVVKHGESEKRVHSVVTLEDMFQPRRVEAGQTPSPNDRKYLLLGNPGTGKTSIGKTLAYGWAADLLCHEFNAVFLLPVRDLTNASFDNGAPRKMRTLTTAIASTCFPRREFLEGEFKALLMQIADDLQKPATLLILDGVDEGDATGKFMVQEAMKRNCHLLLTSRPYNLHGIRSAVGNEMELLGLNDDQIPHFVKGEAPKHMKGFLDYIQTSPSLWEMAHVPLTSSILCSVWDDGFGKHTIDGCTYWNRFLVYDQMVRCLWERYLKKLKNVSQWVPNRDKIFDSLEKLAFQATQKGQVLMNDRLVMEYAPDGDDGGVLREAGFLLLQMEGKRYQFPHLSFQEFFTGQCLAHSLYKASPTRKENALTFIAKNKYKEVHGDAMSFMMQSVVDEFGDSGVAEILSIVEQEPRDLIGMQHMFMKLRMVEAFLSIKEKPIDESEAYNPCNKVMEAASKLFAQLGAKDEHLDMIVHQAEQSPTVAKCFPKLVQPLVDQLIREPKDKRSKKLGRIARIARISPVVKHSFEQFLHKMYEEEDSEHRTNAIANLMPLVDATSDITEFVVHLLNEGCCDSVSCVRRAAINVDEHLVRSKPSNATKYMRVLIDGCSDKDPGTRAQCLVHLAKCASCGIDLAKDAWNQLVENDTSILNKALRDENVDVRKRAMQAVFEFAYVLSADGEQALMIQSKLSEIRNDQDQSVRIEGVSRLGRLAKSGPNNATLAWTLLSQSLVDKVASVRVEALQQVSEVSRAASMDISFTLDVLKSKFSDDDDLDVRITAIQQTVNYLACVEDSESLIAFLEHACDDPNTQIREEACRCVAIVCESYPALASSALKILKAKVEDEDENVRGKAIQHYLELSHLNESEEETSAVLSLGSEDPVEWIREQTAIQKRHLSMTKEEKNADQFKLHLMKFNQTFDHAAMEELIKIAASEGHLPDYAQSMIEAASRALEHSDEQIRWRGVLILGTVVRHNDKSETAPGYVLEAVRWTFEATKDPSNAVKNEAQKLIQVAPFKNLLDYYWSTHDGEFVAALADRLVQTAVTAIPFRRGTQSKLVIYEASEEFLHIGSREDVQHLVSLMKSSNPDFQ